VDDPYLRRWKERQAEHLATIRREFAPTPVLTAPLQADEVTGADALAELADALYGDVDEQRVLHRDRPLQVLADGDARLLRVALPFTHKGEVDLRRRGTDLHLRVGTLKRTVALPAALQRLEIARARLEDGVLEIRFVPVPAAGAS
jgi:arsenite/tail-anchored protein-transporting ATPase